MSETTTTTVAPNQAPAPKKKSVIVIIFALAVVGALFVGLAAFGIYTRNQWTAAVQQRANEAARILVDTVHPQKSIGMLHLQLPGQAMPFSDSPIFAQTSGYLKKWYFDIGARVKKGDVLAEIDTPEVDQHLSRSIRWSRHCPKHRHRSLHSRRIGNGTFPDGGDFGSPRLRDRPASFFISGESR
jgi:hypothetical protein